MRLGLKRKIDRLFSESASMMERLKDAVDLLNGRRGVVSSFECLDRLIRQQVYRLVYWKTGRDEINFRRFFDVNNLVGVRVEAPGYSSLPML